MGDAACGVNPSEEPFCTVSSLIFIPRDLSEKGFDQLT